MSALEGISVTPGKRRPVELAPYDDDGRGQRSAKRRRIEPMLCLDVDGVNAGSQCSAGSASVDLFAHAAPEPAVVAGMKELHFAYAMFVFIFRLKRPPSQRESFVMWSQFRLLQTQQTSRRLQAINSSQPLRGTTARELRWMP